MKTRYVSQLPVNMQNAIESQLIALGLDKDDIEKAMNSRLCDLENTINIKPYLLNLFDVEFMFHELDIWFRINDIDAKDEDEAYELAKVKLKEKTGVDPEELAKKNNTIYYMETAYVHFYDEDEEADEEEETECQV